MKLYLIFLRNVPHRRYKYYWFGETFVVHSDNGMKTIMGPQGMQSPNIKAGGTYRYMELNRQRKTADFLNCSFTYTSLDSSIGIATGCGAGRLVFDPR
jgi:hypothetical protein